MPFSIQLIQRGFQYGVGGKNTDSIHKFLSFLIEFHNHFTNNNNRSHGEVQRLDHHFVNCFDSRGITFREFQMRRI